jgi:hypothetical protein
MTILIHAARATREWPRAGVRKGDRMYHVVSDLLGAAGATELRAFVGGYGLRATWAQYPGSYREHFDVRADEGLRMIADGARLITNREMGELLLAKRTHADSAPPPQL